MQICLHFCCVIVLDVFFLLKLKLKKTKTSQSIQ